MSQLDSNDDGEISFDEFKTNMFNVLNARASFMGKK